MTIRPTEGVCPEEGNPDINNGTNTLAPNASVSSVK